MTSNFGLQTNLPTLFQNIPYVCRVRKEILASIKLRKMPVVRRFKFPEGLDKESIEAKLALAIVATECIFGQARVRISAAYCISPKSVLAALKKRLPAGVSSQVPELTDKRFADYEPMPGSSPYSRNIPRERGNDIFLNGNKLSLGDSLFALLMRFVVVLKKGKGGRVNSPDLAAEGFISDSTHYRPYSTLARRHCRVGWNRLEENL